MRYPLISARPAPQRLALALIATGSILALLLAGCSVGTSSSGGQSTALPTFTPPAISTTQPGHTTTALTGIDGVKPHLAGVPSFTTGDMTQYLSDHPITAPDGDVGPASVVSAGFLTCATIDAKVGTPVSQMLHGCFDGVTYGLVIESGTFAFAGADGEPHSNATQAFVLFDASSGNLILLGSVDSQGATPTPTPNPSQSPTPTQPPAKSTATPTPHMALTFKPQSAEQNCLLPSTVLSPITVTLDNSASNVAVSWTASISETVGTSGVIWASASPSSGTIGAGKIVQVVVTPDSKLCTNSQSVVPDATYHVVFHYGSGQQLTFSDLVHSPVPG